MDDFTYILLLAYGVAVGIVILIILLDRLGQVWSSYIVKIVTSISVVWALCTSWMWFYFIALWLSLPAFFIGLILTIYIVRKYGWGRPAKVFASILGLTVVLNLVSLAFFYF